LQTNYFSDNLVAPGIETETSGTGILKEPHDVTLMKTAFVIVTAVKTSNLT
jgi:hypothetical protein